ncbi:MULTISPECIES: hypothetical protein [Moraxella]|uniref:Uncharacterized protein n=1 Tax=Moraxella lacunata TaxID=477 RepID=A0A378QMZ0_MORLA|nr:MULTISPECIES: hypothetical protein [Moraxella]MBE9591693.1 hypothetical protein [Moraxella sp. K127]MBE9597576.1 hypothetical protein [Moraxella sp. K2450]STZ00693.1 Uncharacterised protein [Moraxella lacunata]
MNNLSNLFKMYGNQPQFLLNPYQQITCWSVCRCFDWQIGEQMLNLLLQLKEVALRMDGINKQRLRVSFDNWNPYNVWMDIVVSTYLNRYIDQLREGVSLKKQFPNEFFSFWLDFYTLTRLMDEYRMVFTIGEAFPTKQDAHDFGKISREIAKLDSFLKGGEQGKSIGHGLSNVIDGKERERDVKEYATSIHYLQEPDIYPTYLVYPKAFKYEQEIKQSGLYLPDSPLKSIKVFDVRASEFNGTHIEYLDDPATTKLIRRAEGPIEYGLYDWYSEFYRDPFGDDSIADPGIGGVDWIETDWYYVKEIPPNTEGIPNNPLRLEHLRYPLAEGQKYITLEELKQRDGYAYQNPNAMVNEYFQVVHRYEKFYSNYLMTHGVDGDSLRYS